MNENDNRKEIAKLIEAIISFDNLEKEHLQDTLAWIESGIEIFRIEKPATPLKHLVCYTVLCDLEKQKMLLLEHKTAERLLASGGHVEKGELPYETARREMQEELGMEAQFIQKDWKIPFFLSQVETVGKTPGHIDVDLWYILKGSSNDKLKSETEEFQREFQGYKWYGLDEILTMPIEKFDPNLHRFVKKLRVYIKNNFN